MMKEEFIERLRSIPAHEDDIVTREDYALIEQVYTWHPSIPNVGGKDTIAHLYAYGGMLVIKDMLPRALMAQEIDSRIMSIRKDIQGMEQRIREMKMEVYE